MWKFPLFLCLFVLTSEIAVSALEIEAIGSVPFQYIHAGEWGRCVPHAAQRKVSPRLTFEPQLGEQKREVTCIDYPCQADDPNCCSYKASKVPNRRMCIVSEDCIMSEWSPWKIPQLCSPEENSEYPCVRTRTILSLPQGDGKSCGLLEEINTTCSENLRNKHMLYWAYGAWGPCHAQQLPSITGTRDGQAESNSGRCGGGLQRRTVSCQDRQTREVLPDSACSHLTPPFLVQRCEVACPRDCVVAEWSSWGACEPQAGCPMTPVEEITSTGYRRRNRRVYVAGSPGGAPCGPLIEVQPCSNPVCARWVPEPWSSCRLAQLVVPMPSCGSGRRERRVICQDLQEEELTEEQCLGTTPRPPTVEECRVACPQDCVVSPWGPWTPCSRPCSSRHHKGYRYRNRTIVAPAGIDGEKCPPDWALQQREECNTHGCQSYSWLTLPWQSCVHPSTTEIDDAADEIMREENITNTFEVPQKEPCGPNAIQLREVWCMENGDRKVPDPHCGPPKKPETQNILLIKPILDVKGDGAPVAGMVYSDKTYITRNCGPAKKPETQKICEKQCERPCVLSPWSEWSPCPENCEGGIQERGRYMVLGWEQMDRCGALTERRSCPVPTSDSPAGGVPHWAHGAWSTCQLAYGKTCGKGIMTRGVWCSLQHHKVGVGACTGPPPPSALRCTVECESKCQLSDWSPWVLCTEPCGKMATRFRKKLGEEPCPNTVLYEAHECPCQGFEVSLTGSWSHCIIDSPDRCGSGWRYRRVFCKDAAGRGVEPHWCKNQLFGYLETGKMDGLVREPCNEACPVDCHLSEWSTWGDCILPERRTCGVGLSYRTRNILVNASSDGRPCMETIQSKVCTKTCSSYAWEAGGWTSCQLIPRHRSRGCGTGDQSRTVRCVEISTGDTVADALCDPVNQPADLNACHLPCPGECVLSEWSDWSQCPKPCSHKMQRDRTRALLRAGSPGQRCPPMVQAQPCVLNHTCFHYHWRITQWGACLPLGGSSCGEGTQQRMIYCERSDGRHVNNTFCDTYSRPVEPTEQFCFVDCPIDCEISDWGTWDDSACEACGMHRNFAMVRSRRVITPASKWGRPCLGPWHERIACPVRPCYIKVGEEFSECKLDDGVNCGFGKMTRNMTCVRETDQQPIPLSYCNLQTSSWQDLYEEKTCYVECKNECRNSEWSAWTSCDEGGVKSRTRIVYTPEGPPCTSDTKQEHVYEYGSCNGSIIKLEVDITKWKSQDKSFKFNNNQDEESPNQEADDYYIQEEEDTKKVYIIGHGEISATHTLFALCIAFVSLCVMMGLLMWTYKYKQQQYHVHKV